MSVNYKILVIDSSAPPTPVQATLQDLKDAVLSNPSLALDALRFAMQQGPGTGTTTSAGTGTGGAVTTFGNLPLDTPIFKMLSPDQAKILTSNAAKLTKEDLLDLAGVGPVKKTAEQLQLTFDDVKSIQDAFHTQFSTDVQGLKIGNIEITRCCCTPCCCCTAVSVPDARRRIA